MNVLEVKNNLVKISYNTEDNLQLSGFVVIEDTNTPYVAQVMNLKNDSTGNYAIVKLLFTFDDEGILKNYNGTIPSVDAVISKIPSSELLDVIPIDNPLILGNLAQQGMKLKVDKSILENNLLVCSNNLANTEDLLVCLTSQIKDEKVVIIDSEGQLKIDEKVVLGQDFKLPLNFETIDYIYENDLENVDSVNKAIIQDILIEVQNYVKTLPEKFIPFDKFITVIDSQYRETQIPELILLKNKLLKYKDMNLFAETLKEILDLSIKIDKNTTTVIDISTVPDDVQKEVIRYIYTALNDIESKIYAFAKVNNSNITKRLLKRFIAKDNVYTTIICPHEFKYIEEIKEFSQNIIFFTPSTLTHDFASYNTYLNKLNSNEFVVYGAHTQNIPMIVEVTDDLTETPQVSEYDEHEEAEVLQTETLGYDAQDNTFEMTETVETNETDVTDVTDDIAIEGEATENIFETSADNIDEVEVENISETVVENVDETPVENVDIVENVTETDVVESKADSEIDIVEDDYEPLESTSEEVEQDILTDTEDDIIVEPFDAQVVPEISDEPQIVEEEPEIQVEEEQVEKQELVEEEPEQFNPFKETVVSEPVIEETDVVEPLVSEEEISHDELVEQVAQDVERSFYEKLPAEDDEFRDEEIPVKDDLTEDDLNLIEDLAVDDVPLAGGEMEVEEEDLPPEEEPEVPPVVPIYPADDIDERDGHTFMPGDRVLTEKYGEGIVEKMIKYGNKMLCSIDFPDIGRRLLDPNMTDIKRI